MKCPCPVADSASPHIEKGIESVLQESVDGSRQAIRYKRRFRIPFRSATRSWADRTGWILRRGLGERGWTYAEMCGVPGFPGSSEEEMEEKISRWLTRGNDGDPGSGGAAVFARWSLEQVQECDVSVDSAGLLAADDDLSQAATGFSVLKVKVGASSVRVEQGRVERILAESPEGCRIRLDANQSLSMEDLRRWMKWMTENPRIEYIEQPVAVGCEGALLEEFGPDARRIALDESVSTREDLRRLTDAGWPGPFVVKPMLFGDPQALLELSSPVRDRVVLSSVFETGIGFGKLLHLAEGLGSGGTVHGLGTRGFFEDAESDGWAPASRYSGRLTASFYEGIWNHALACSS